MASGDKETERVRALVEDTADDAALSKRSAVDRGYYDDKYIGIMVPKSHRRAPLINRGYFSRVYALERVVRAFLEGLKADGEVGQVVSLGAGMDTLYFRLLESGVDVSLFVELDLASMTLAKASAIGANADLRELVGCTVVETKGGEGYVDGKGYRLRRADLRKVEEVDGALKDAGLDFSKPTLFLSECVLVYLSPEDSGALLEWIPKVFERAVCVTYEQIRPNDAFGQVMCRNLAARGAPLMGLQGHPSLEAQVDRFLSKGWSFASSMDMNHVYSSVIPVEVRTRIARVEMFDEIEEWRLMQGHYCITIAVKEPDHPPPKDKRPEGHEITEEYAGFNYDPTKHPKLAALLFPPPSKP